MYDFAAEQPRWIGTVSSVDGHEARPPNSSKMNILSFAATVVPRSWVAVGRRLVSAVVGQLPVDTQYRFQRLVSRMRADMGEIERDYPMWIERFDRVDGRKRRMIADNIASMQSRPLISVLMPVFNPSPDHLAAAIQSVRDQLYPTWELCIADDASTSAAVRQILQEAAACDDRIKVVRREQNGHISAASNSALELATGSFIALLDHDDLLPPHALFEVTAVVVSRPDVDIIYSDEDHIDNMGRRSHPYFKPDWNAELMLGQNLISHLGVYRRTLIEKVGGFRLGFEGSQDHDLALRVVAETDAERIVHVPKVLYHWRQGAGEQTFSEAAQDRCAVNGRRAVEAFVGRTQPDAKVHPAPLVDNWTRVIYPLPTPDPMVSIIIYSEDTRSTLRSSIETLLEKTDYPAVEIIIAGDAVDLKNIHTPDRRWRVIRSLPLSLNEAVASAHGELVTLLDPTLEARNPDWLREMASHAIRPAIGAVGAKLLSSHDTVLHAGIVVGGREVAFTPFFGRRRSHVGYFGHLQLARNVSAVSGGCVMVRRTSFIQVGGIDETLTPAFGDIDLCLKLEREGLKNLWTPYAELHRRSGSVVRTGSDVARFRRAATSMRARWGERLAYDPYWSPNLAADPHRMALAFPPQDNRLAAHEAA